MAAVSETTVVAGAAVAAAEPAVRATVAIAETTVAAVAETPVVISEASVLRAAAVSEASVVVRAACITETTVWVHLRSVLAVQITERSSSAVITTVESVSHTYSRMSSWVRAAETSSVIPASVSVYSPAMTSTVRYVEVRATEVEIVAARIAGVDAEVPVARMPVERTVEIGGIEICSVLPVEQDIAQIHIALAPVSTIQVIVCIYTHQVVKVHLVSCLILVFRKIELVSHLVCQEESLLSCLLITHCRSGSECHHEHGYQSYYHSFHNRISLNCYTSCFFFLVQRYDVFCFHGRDFP